MSRAASDSAGCPASPHRDLRNAFLCGLLVALAVLIAWPIAEVGRNDDWSYALTSLVLSRTGRMSYNGWSTAMLGAQAFWGAGVIKLLGFSFTTLRLSTLPFSCGTTALLFQIARRLGASTAIAMLAALTVGLSQVGIECAASFSTDLPALLCFTFALLQVDRSLEPKRRRPSQIMTPLFLAAIAGYSGGSIRQVYWLMPLVALSYAAWVRRRQQNNLALILSLLAIVIAAIAATEWWSHAQPFFIPEYFSTMASVFAAGFPRTLLPVFPLVLTLVLFALPMIIGTWPLQKTPGASLMQAGGIVAGAGALWIVGRGALAPWLGNLVTEFGMMYQGQEAIGDLPQVIPDLVRVLLTLACCAVATRLLWGAIRSAPALAKSAVGGAIPHVLCITALFSLPYTALILFRGPAFVLVDRYTLPLTAVLCLWLAWLSAQRRYTRPTMAGWSILVVVALFAISVVHDNFAAIRARLLAANALTTTRHVPRTAITAGVDYDAWTQLQQVGYINDARIRNPPNAFVPHPRAVPEGKTDFWFWEWSPVVRPDYFIVNSPQADLEDMPAMTFPYRAWLPPFNRAVYVQRRPPGWTIDW